MSTGGQTGGVGMQALPEPLPEFLSEPLSEHLPELLPEFLPEPLPHLLALPRLHPRPPLTSSNSLNSKTRMAISCEDRNRYGGYDKLQQTMHLCAKFIATFT